MVQQHSRVKCRGGDMSDSPCSWIERNPNDESVNGSEVTGTNKELLRRITIAEPKYKYHMFRLSKNRTALNDKLRNETFDGNTDNDATVIVDWSAGYKMTQHCDCQCARAAAAVLQSDSVVASI
jgi:hypothetical protein